MSTIFRFAITVSLVLSMTGVSAMHVENTHSGSWYNSSQSGHGFNFEVLDDQTMIAYWYVYNPDGTPTFLVTIAEIDDDMASGKIYYYSGMKFGEFDPLTIKEEIWGTMSIQFMDCNTAQVHYNSDMSYDGVPFGSGTIDVTRLTSIQGLNCKYPQSLTMHGNYTADILAEGDVGDAYVMILEDGTMTYSSAISGNDYDLGIGQLTMNGETTFDFELLLGEHYGSGSIVFRGAGDFSDGLSLELPEGLRLLGNIDPATFEGINLNQLAGTFAGWGGPGLFGHVKLDIAEDGSVTGETLFGCRIVGNITIPDEGINQFQLDAELFTGGYCNGGALWTSVGRLDGHQMHLITRWGLISDSQNGIWGSVLTEQ